MNIFITNVPETLSRKDLQQFISGALKSRWRLPFTHRDLVFDCKIIRITAMDTSTMETHGLVRAKNSKCGMEIIKRINGSQLMGHQIEARRFFRRSTTRDRRIPNAHLDIFFNNDRRQDDRRRSRLIIGTSEAPEIMGMDRFHRTYG